MEEVARYWFTAVRLLLSFQFPLFCNKEKSPLRRCVLCRQIEKEANMAGRSGDFLVLFFTCPFELWPKLLLKQALHWLKHLKCLLIALFEPIKSFVYVLDKDSVKYQPRNLVLLVEWLTAPSDGNHSKSKRWTIFFKQGTIFLWRGYLEVCISEVSSVVWLFSLWSG